jgi:outer membrane protein assembly factor BamD
VEEALEIMIESYDNLGLEDLKKNSLQVLAANYPNNNLVN